MKLFTLILLYFFLSAYIVVRFSNEFFITFSILFFLHSERNFYCGRLKKIYYPFFVFRTSLCCASIILSSEILDTRDELIRYSNALIEELTFLIKMLVTTYLRSWSLCTMQSYVMQVYKLLIYTLPWRNGSNKQEKTEYRVNFWNTVQNGILSGL